MEVKKSNKVSLEQKKVLFLEVGMVIVLAICLVAFEWTTSPVEDEEKEDNKVEEYSLEQAEVVPEEQLEQQATPEVTPIFEQLEFKESENLDFADTFSFTFASEETGPSFEFLDDDDDDEKAASEVFFIVEDMPKFNGGPSDDFRTYISENLQYPQIAAENGISGRVYVQFTVDRTGKVTDVVVARGVDPALDKEALRVVKSSPLWTPGKQRGRPVNVRFTFPIVFVLQ